MSPSPCRIVSALLGGASKIFTIWSGISFHFTDSSHHPESPCGDTCSHGPQPLRSLFLLISLPEMPSGVCRTRLPKLSTSATTLCSSVTLFLIAEVGSTPSFQPPLYPGKPLPTTQALLCPYSCARLSWEAASSSVTGAPSESLVASGAQHRA